MYKITIEIEYIGKYHRQGEKKQTPGALQFYDCKSVKVQNPPDVPKEDHKAGDVVTQVLDQRFIVQMDVRRHQIQLREAYSTASLKSDDKYSCYPLHFITLIDEHIRAISDLDSGHSDLSHQNGKILSTIYLELKCNMNFVFVQDIQKGYGTPKNPKYCIVKNGLQIFLLYSKI